MGAISVILLVVFVIICVLLVLLVLVQNEEGMGLLGSGASTAFGSHSANILTKTTYVLVVLFFVSALGLALLNKKPRVQSDLSGAAQSVEQSAEQSSSEWWKEGAD